MLGPRRDLSNRLPERPFGAGSRTRRRGYGRAALSASRRENAAAPHQEAALRDDAIVAVQRYPFAACAILPCLSRRPCSPVTVAPPLLAELGQQHESRIPSTCVRLPATTGGCASARPPPTWRSNAMSSRSTSRMRSCSGWSMKPAGCWGLVTWSSPRQHPSSACRSTARHAAAASAASCWREPAATRETPARTGWSCTTFRRTSPLSGWLRGRACASYVVEGEGRAVLTLPPRPTGAVALPGDLPKLAAVELAFRLAMRRGCTRLTSA